MTPTKKWTIAAILNITILLAYTVPFLLMHVNKPEGISGFVNFDKAADGFFSLIDHFYEMLVLATICFQFLVNLFAIATYFILKINNQTGKVGLAYLMSIGMVMVLGVLLSAIFG